MSTSDDTEIVRGHVKWFDPAKGFGFVVAESDGPDILLHANVLRNFGQSSVADGALVEVVVQQTPRGRQAVEVRRIEPPVIADQGMIGGLTEELIDPSTVGPAQPARVKWFDKSKGFGFANVFGSAEDIFIHIEVLRRSGLADLQPGEAISIRVVSGRRGLMAAVVSSWETAVNPPEQND